ncbi:hypothetical protein IED13_12765 [Bosea sp. SSUT16]|jgi:hypothetical protein|uniref:Uncharacterized protein n=1 Tax=Bosea spartocytisi TaxID=2773451 RepID=A0A927E897_9HYPH|nr:hypothetical protein [Bosea spartocytisi]MBD3846573.1 hypothetical protein [Bosea spartocytisi]MCT4472118.1 hypothetical protein [Bosea spartocytisi]
MPPPRSTEHVVLSVLSAAALAALAILAWRAVGWLGVGVLGLLVLFIAVRVELEGNRPMGPQMTPGLYADQYRSEVEAEPAARAGRRAERLSVIGAARLARLFGAVLAVTGFGLFLLL